MGSSNDVDKLQQQQGLLLRDPPKARKGGLRTISFIIVNESFERLASVGLMPNMTFYLRDEYHLEVATISIILGIWSSLSNGLAIFGAVVADSFLGRFQVIAIGTFSSLIGMTMLWLTTMFPQLRPLPCDEFGHKCSYPTAAQFVFLISSFGLISIGAGSVRPCSTAFGIDQLYNKEEHNNERLLQSFINWYNVSLAIASIFALTIIVYIQDHLGWQVGFAVPALLMVFALLIIFLGSNMYVKAKSMNNLFIGLLQVLVVAFRNRDINLPSNQSDISFHHEPQSEIITPSGNLRCLNKACIIKDPERDLNADGSALDPWSLCTVRQVESLKALLRLIPLWSSGIMLIVSMNQGSFSVLQAESMDRSIFGNLQIPAGSFSVIMVIAIVIYLPIYDRLIVPLLARCMGHSHGLSCESRMGISLILSSIAMVVAAVVESKRREVAIEQGLQHNPHAKVDMSAVWLIPQYLMIGVAEAISTTSQAEFFYTQLPKEMSSIAMSLYTIELAAGSIVGVLLVDIVNEVTGSRGKISWLASNINEGHVNYYYWLMASLGLINFMYFLVCLWAYGPGRDESLVCYKRNELESH